MSADFIKDGRTITVSAQELTNERLRQLINDGWIPTDTFSADAHAIVDSGEGRVVQGVRGVNRAQLLDSLRGIGPVRLSFDGEEAAHIEAQQRLDERAQQYVDTEGGPSVIGEMAASRAASMFDLEDTLGLRESDDPLYESIRRQEEGVALGATILGDGIPMLAGGVVGWGVRGAMAARGAGAAATALASSTAAGAVEGGGSFALDFLQLTDEELAQADAPSMAEMIMQGAALGGALGLGSAAIGNRIGRLFGRGGRETAESLDSLGARGERVMMSSTDELYNSSPNRLRQFVEEIASGTRTPSEFTERAYEIYQGFQENASGWLRRHSDNFGDLNTLFRQAIDDLSDVSATARRFDDGASGAVRSGFRQIADEFDVLRQGLSTGARSQVDEAFEAVRRLGEVPTNDLSFSRFPSPLDWTSVEKAADDLYRLRRTVPQADGAYTALDDLISKVDGLLDNTLPEGQLSSPRRQALDRLERARQAAEETFVDDKIAGVGLNRTARGVAVSLDYRKFKEFADMFSGIEAWADISGNGAAAQQARTFASSMHRMVDEAEMIRRLQGTAKEGERMQGIFSSMGLGGPGAAIGAAVGGVPGAIAGFGAGALVGAMSRPVSWRVRMMGLKRAFNRITGRTTRAVGKAKTAIAATDNTKLKDNFISLKPRPGTIARYLLKASPEERRDRYDRLLEEIEVLAADPNALLERMAPEIEGLGSVNPGLPREMGLHATKALSTLLALSPSRRSRRSRSNLFDFDIPPAQVEVDEFLRVAAALEDPIFGLEMLSAGQLTPRAGRAMREVFPNLMGQVTQELLMHVASRRQRGQNVNYQTLLHYSSALGAPLDRTMDPGFINQMQSQSTQTGLQEQAQFSRPVSNRRSTALTQNHETASQRLNQ